MNTFKTVKYKKGDTIFVSGQKPYDTFFIIIKGHVLIQSHIAGNETSILKKGDFLGLISAISKEPFFTTATAMKDSVLIKVSVKDIKHIQNKSITDNILKYLAKSFDTIIKGYLNTVSKHIFNEEYREESLINLADYFKSKGRLLVAGHMYAKYLDLFNGFKREYAKNAINEIGDIKDSKNLNNNLIKYKKHACIFSEQEYDKNIYIIKSGKVGLYNVLNGHKITQMIFAKGAIIGYKSPDLAHSSTAIAIEETVLEKIDINCFNEKLNNDEKLKSYMIQFLSRCIWTLIIKIESLYMKSPPGKLYNIIYSLYKYELSRSKNKIRNKIPYCINEILDMAGIIHVNKKTEIMKTLEKNKHIEINDKDIIINDKESLKQDLILNRR